MPQCRFAKSEVKLHGGATTMPSLHGDARLLLRGCLWNSGRRPLLTTFWQSFLPHRVRRWKLQPPGPRTTASEVVIYVLGKNPIHMPSSPSALPRTSSAALVTSLGTPYHDEQSETRLLIELAPSISIRSACSPVSTRWLRGRTRASPCSSRSLSRKPPALPWLTHAS